MTAAARPTPLDLGRRPPVLDSPPPPLTVALQLPTQPLADVESAAKPDRYSAECRTDYWNHVCPADGCTTWVPNHLHACAEHGSPQ